MATVKEEFRRMIESLIRAGALDSLEGTRAQLFAAVEGAMEAGQRCWCSPTRAFAAVMCGGVRSSTPIHGSAQ